LFPGSDYSLFGAAVSLLRSITSPRAPPPNCPAMIQAAALDCADSDSVFTMSPPQAAATKKVMRPPARMSAVIKARWEAPMSGKYRQANSAVPKLASTSQVLRRNLMSTTGAKRKPMTPGKLMIELMLAIRSTGTPACASSNGKAVKLKPPTTRPWKRKRSRPTQRRHSTVPALRWLAEKAFLTKISCASSASINDRTARAGTDRRGLVARGSRRAIDRETALQILYCVDRYLTNRTGDVKKPKPPFTGFRLRCGDYRVFFDQRDENTIMITAVRNRREAYR
jgi:mRNA-degrading endonuclease RelE of RelBE toxin-antitoxin system